MSVLLRQSRAVPESDAYQSWLAVTGTTVGLDADRNLPGLAERLERAFVAERETWWRLGRALSGEPSADVAHMPTAGSFGSDFGVMLAWRRLVGTLAREDAATLVVCDDPWLFRQLSTMPGVDSGPPPPIVPKEIALAVRGVLARAWTALRCAWATLRLAGDRRVMMPGAAVILVYGHPASDARGNDAYFGDLMVRFPTIQRLLHTDCRTDQARKLSADGRTASLHAWGHPVFALGLVFSRWRSGRQQPSGEYDWLVRRARAMENGGGGPAMNRWQMHCQGRWLAAARPGRVLWPWENLGWERALCRAARRLGVVTLGYQHTVIGPHQFNYSPATNADGEASLPDTIVCDGPAYRDQLASWGIPDARMVIGGSLRIKRSDAAPYDPAGPVFVALSARLSIARQQLRAIEAVAGDGIVFVVKDHPMYPMPIRETVAVRRAQGAMGEQPPLRAVIYSTGTSGLEAILAGLPTFRFLPDDEIAIDILPPSVTAVPVAGGRLADALAAPPERPAVRWDDVLSSVDWDLWQHLLAPSGPPPAVGNDAAEMSRIA